MEYNTALIAAGGLVLAVVSAAAFFFIGRRKGAASELARQRAAKDTADEAMLTEWNTMLVVDSATNASPEIMMTFRAFLCAVQPKRIEPFRFEVPTKLTLCSSSGHMQKGNRSKKF